MSEKRNAAIRLVREASASVAPSLDDVARDPRTVGGVTPEQAEAMVPVCAAVLAALRERASSRVLPLATDRALGAEEVAAMIGMSKSWVEHNLDKLPPRRSVAGNPKWLLSEITAWLKEARRYGSAA